MGVSVAVTGVRYPMALLREVYKSDANGGKKLLVECERGVQLLDLPQLSSGNRTSVFAEHLADKCAALSLEEEKNKSGNKHLFSCFTLVASESLEMMNVFLFCLLCGLYGVLAKGK